MQPEPPRPRPWQRRGQAREDEMLGSPLTNMYTKLSKRSSIL